MSPGLPALLHADLGLLRQGYFGLNTSDMERQRTFYGTLGFKGQIYPAGPETSTTFARALGFADDYLIHVALNSLEDPPVMPFVDTVQFRGDSYRDEPPYANLNHIGMAYATYSTTDLDGDYAYLMGQGVEFVSPPTTAPNGERFVFLKDQDGTFLKLIEEGGNATAGPDLVRLVNTNMNVADLDRSREFYRLLGFTEEEDGSQEDSGAFAEAHGFDGPIKFEGVDVSLPGSLPPFVGGPEATLQLRRWKTPFKRALCTTVVFSVGRAMQDLAVVAGEVTVRLALLRRVLRLILPAVIAAGSLIAPLHATARSADASDGETPDITPVIEKYRATILRAMRGEHIPGLAIAVVDDKDVLWLEGWGYTDTDHATPVTPDTPFSIQSMSKSFTALTVLMAVQDGLLDLNAPLSTYLPDFRVNSIYEPDAADKITG